MGSYHYCQQGRVNQNSAKTLWRCLVSVFLPFWLFSASAFANSDQASSNTSTTAPSASTPASSDDPSAAFRNWGLRVEAGYTYDDNLARADEAHDRLSDQIYSINLNKTFIIPLTYRTRWVFNGFVGSEKLNHYSRLDRFFGGAQLELQYRMSGDFLAPTFGLFQTITRENYRSSMRDGFRYSTGISIRQPITDRINLYGAYAYNRRNAEDPTFTTRDNSFRLNLDYAAIANSTFYLTAEYRSGDTVSAGPPTLEAVDLAKSVSQDDVFRKQGFWDYRIKARTVLTTIGYNLPFGSMNSLDISWRRAESNPTDDLSFSGTKPSYIDNQVSIVYLLRF